MGAKSQIRTRIMATEERSSEGKKPGREPLTPAKRKRLEKVFEHVSKKATTANDFDYFTELLSQCVVGDPSNGAYVRAYIENLQKKYGNNKKGSSLAQLKEWGSRSALKKALAQEQWDEVIRHGLKILTVNPWDVTALTGMATAAGKSGDRDCELYYLRCATSANPKDPECNRLYGAALGERGLFDQAIACWHRVEEARPDDDEARRAIAVLTVQKARSRGEFDDDETSRTLRVRAQQQEEATHEQRMLNKIKQDPANLNLYLELSQLYVNDERYKESEALLAKAYELSERNPDIREKWEDAQLRYLRQKIAAAKDPAVKQKLQAEYFEKDMVVCKNRVDRYPNNLAFKYELGYRYMLTKRYSEAIQELQVAKNDPRRKGACLLVLGQCFQHIKQYRLAMSHYESAIQEIPDRDAENKKKALHLAGRLAMALKDVDAAERHLTTLAGLDFTYKDVSALLDKIAELRENPDSDDGKATGENQAEGEAEPNPDDQNDQQSPPASS
jgi:tetratricopeptide (TPR) repeat protein